MQHLRLQIADTVTLLPTALHFWFTVNVCWCWSRDWTCQLQCWTVLCYCYQLQCHWVLAGSWRWLSTTVQDRPRSDFSSSITGVHWTCVQCLWGSDGGQAQQDDQRAGTACFPAIELEIRLNWTDSTELNWTELWWACRLYWVIDYCERLRVRVLLVMMTLSDNDYDNDESCYIL